MAAAILLCSFNVNAQTNRMAAAINSFIDFKIKINL